jgi:hypothetical protein
MAYNTIPISFPASNSTGTITSDLLQSYEEGTFVPSVSGTTTPGTQTYSTQVGRYTKIGRQVFYEIDIVLTSATGTGIVTISGFPFVANSAVSEYPAAFQSFNFLVATATQIMPFLNGGGTNMMIFGYNASTGSLIGSDLTANTTSSMRLVGSYQV